MSELGHSRHFRSVRRTSAYPLRAAREQKFRDRRFGPIPDSFSAAGKPYSEPSGGSCCAFSCLVGAEYDLAPCPRYLVQWGRALCFQDVHVPWNWLFHSVPCEFIRNVRLYRLGCRDVLVSLIVVTQHQVRKAAPIQRVSVF